MKADSRIVPAATELSKPSLPPLIPASALTTASSAIVEYTKPVLPEDEEDIEIKLRRIIDNVPIRVSNTSGSSAGSGSGDFHQYRQMRRKEQDRLARMDADYQRRKEEAEFNMRREERLKAAEERTAKKRLKRQKKKQIKKEKKLKVTAGGDDPNNHKEESSTDDDEDSSLRMRRIDVATTSNSLREKKGQITEAASIQFIKTRG